MKNAVVQKVALPPQIDLKVEVDGRIEVRLVILKQIKVYSVHDIASFLPQPKVFHLIVEVCAAEGDEVFLKVHLESNKVRVIENFGHR